ncbi:MAG TPA: GNAT family N-acetyltransferase [Aggregatilineaceae bacterium]|nr:GNAT family N-acetyltransferase [Aggregatilineaceae bacterium]
MTDMLVKLYALPPVEADIAALDAAGVMIRRALAPEKHLIAKWIGETFSAFWQSEAEVAVGRTPPACWIAIEAVQLIGFSCYDTTGKGFLGPIGVHESQRGRGVGRVLLLACLHAMRLDGYGYAIIGGVGPMEFYQKTVGAVIIEDSTPGMYRGMLRP